MDTVLMKSDMDVENFDAKIQAKVLKLGVNDKLLLSRMSMTRKYFEDITVKNMSQATIDLLVTTLKDKSADYPYDILRVIKERFTEANWIELAHSRNHSMCIHEKGLMKKYPSVAEKITAIVLNGDEEVDADDIDYVIAACAPEELDQYKDNLLTQRQLASYQHCPMVILDHYKDCMDAETLARILDRNAWDKEIKMSTSQRCDLFTIQKWIATHRYDFMVKASEGCTWNDDYAERLMKFIVRYQKKLKIVVTAVPPAE